MSAPLQCQQDAARVATTADQAVAYARHQGCRDAFALILDGEPDMARWGPRPGGRAAGTDAGRPRCAHRDRRDHPVPPVRGRRQRGGVGSVNLLGPALVAASLFLTVLAGALICRHLARKDLP